MLKNIHAVRRLAKNPAMARGIHSIQQSGVEKTQNETPVLVYQAQEFEGFHSMSTSAAGEISSWDSKLLNSDLKSKFFGLIPFQIESVSLTFLPMIILTEIHKEIIRFKDGGLPRVEVLKDSFA